MATSLLAQTLISPLTTVELPTGQSQLIIHLKTSYHTYGDAVRGVIVLRNPEKILLELLEMRFHGECGTDIRYVVELPTNHSHTTTTATGKASEKKHLFTHTRTITQMHKYEAGTHEFKFEFRFPRREEVQLSPNSDPFTIENFFYFNYELTATATVFDGSAKRTLTATRYPTFVSSRDVSTATTALSFFYARSFPQLSFRSRVFSMTTRKSGLSPQPTQTDEFYGLLQIPKVVVGRDPFPVILQVRQDPAFPGQQIQHDAKIRLLRFKMYLRSRVQLTAQGHTAQVDLSKNEPLQITDWTSRRPQDTVELTFGEPHDVGLKLGLKCPHYIRATFRNDLVKYEYVLRIRAAFDFCGRTYVVTFDDVPIELQPHFVKDDREDRDYASSPPDELPPQPDSPFSESPFSSEPSDPPTPPPTFEEAMSDPFQGRWISTDSSISAISL